MASGFRSDETTASDDDREEWAEILHLDIKPHNILMADPDPDTEDEKAKQYGWPKIQVTDFGVSVELRPEWKNPQDLTGRGTQGYQAPEQLRQIKRDPKEYPIQQLCAKTNIWGIGAVLYDLMNPRIHKKEHGEQSGGPILTDSTNASRSRIGYHEDLIASGQKQLAWRMVPKDESRSSNRSSKSVESDHVNAYSDGLVDFVTQCLEFLPENRPDLEEMDETIEDNLDQWYASTKDYWSKVDHLDFETCILKLKKPLKDDYAIGHKQAVVEGVEVAALGGGEAEEHDVEEEERLE
jgi:serine/threonine protein kinase